MIGRIVFQPIEYVVMDISILVKLALALVIVLNTNNSATEKTSVRKLIYKPKFNIAARYTCIGIIIIIFLLAPFFITAIFE